MDFLAATHPEQIVRVRGLNVLWSFDLRSERSRSCTEPFIYWLCVIVQADRS